MLHIHVLEKNVFSIQKGSAVCVCCVRHVWTYMHTPTHKQLSPNPWDQICWLSSDLLYTYWFVSARFFFKLLIEVVKISHYDCGLFSCSNISLLCFLYFETFETILGSYKIKTVMSFWYVEPFLRIFLDLKFDILLNNYFYLFIFGCSTWHVGS